MSSAKIKNIYVLENHADNAALCFAGVRGGGFCRVRIYALLFLNHIHIHIQIHIHSANGLQNLHLHNTTMQNYAKSAFAFFVVANYTLALNLYIIITYGWRLCR